MTPAVESLAKYSPDGRWVAYQTNASGRFEIVVQPFGEGRPAGRWQISTDGGTQPMWRPDGKELYFVAPDSALYAVAVTPGQDTFNFSPPVRLFATRMAAVDSARMPSNTQWLRMAAS